MAKALFLDRDGTINVDEGYVHEIERIVFNPGIFDLCREAQALGFLIIIVTNQSGIARGYYTEDDYQRLSAWMTNQFASEGVRITDSFHCPDLSGPDRKPNPGMFLRARDKYKLDMGLSVSVGDKPRDVDAATAAGVGLNFLYEGDFKTIISAIKKFAHEHTA